MLFRPANMAVCSLSLSLTQTKKKEESCGTKTTLNALRYSYPATTQLRKRRSHSTARDIKKNRKIYRSRNMNRHRHRSFYATTMLATVVVIGIAACLRSVRTFAYSSRPGVVTRVLYPVHPLYPRQADEPYQGEFELIRQEQQKQQQQQQKRTDVDDAGVVARVESSLFDFDEFVATDGGTFRPRPRVEKGDTVLYRGWMMRPDQYEILCDWLERDYGATPLTSSRQYARCHHLPGWYGDCRDLTAETRWFETKKETKDEDGRAVLQPLLPLLPAAKDWPEKGFFVKDYVKSNAGGSEGSICRSADELARIVDQLRLYRGSVEGGICLREVEDFVPGSERRYFVARGIPLSAANGEEDGEDDEIIPGLVRDVARRIDGAPFYSVDVARTTSGEWHLVELGDGQVSDKKEWTDGRFVDAVLLSVLASPLPPTTK